MRTFVAACTLVGLLSVSSVAAITIAPLSFDQLVDRASMVVYGRVAQVHGQWTADRREIESLVTLQPLQLLKGEADAEVTFRTPGGQVGDLITVWPGAPVYRRGDLVVVFLAAQGPAVPTVVGLTQGVLRVSPDARSGELLARPRPRELPSTTAAAGSAVPLSQLASQVRAVAGAAR